VKFRVLPKVHGFTDTEGVTHLPGDIVDLPASYKGETWLESLEPEPKIMVPPAKVEAPAVIPFEEPKAKKGKKAK
jgi:hypothetical protein